MTYQPSCPYSTDVEIQAWGEGLTVGLHNLTAERNESNPYTSGDTCVAWAQGWDDGKYKPAPFNPLTISELPDRIQNYITVNLGVRKDPANRAITRGIYLEWAWVGGTLEGRPEWANNRQPDRSISLESHDARRWLHVLLQSTSITSPASVELPCPPYEYEYSQGGMEISAGVFKKWGSKDDWDGVLTEMRQKWEEIPAGLDIQDVNIDMYCTQAATARWNASLSAVDLLSGDDQLDGNIWQGTKDELESALESALENVDSGDVNDYYSDVEYEMDDWAEVEIEVADLTYDLQDVEEA